ncbi:MAG: hypothetical protein DME11_20140 [Candidatus Rokuibacteriota bacterium]|nr:MAG: hypothetical protein DMD80_01250 [Candidatus Rokubacteria bacterium]PYM62371.1 MAG: hypothetical protein DME11_20140 [Candidatus Rokubacteria bacterium]PYQ01944.1 MAG: hypothetical protein DMF83_24610 [Acidobacteriota bacterium]
MSRSWYIGWRQGGRPIKLLLIEDDVLVAELLSGAFADEGHQTTVSHTGEEGLRHLEGDRPDAVLLDLCLPTINGIEVLRAIRLTDFALPVILITGYANPGQLAEARQLGVTDVIAKSYVLTRFTDVLVRIAGTSGPA